MKIVTVRRIAQIFFFALFAWFCVVTTIGDRWWQLRGLAGQLAAATRSAGGARHVAHHQDNLRRPALGAGHCGADDFAGPVFLRLGLSVRRVASIHRLARTPPQKNTPSAWP